jgi:Tfp pilus assembly protein PilN
MLNQFFNINTAIGINLTIQSNGELVINACLIVRHKKQLDFEQKVVSLKSLEDLTKNFSNKVPLALSISGKGILTKSVEKIDELTPITFSQVLPNANFEDFYIQNFVSADKSYISVIRKTEADKWLAHLKELGYKTVILSLGPFAVNNILPQLNFYDGEIVFDGNIVQRDENKCWKSYRYDELSTAPFPIKIESEKIDEKLLIPYASAFQLVMNGKLDAIQTDNETLRAAHQDVVATKWAKTYGAITVIVIFILLLINFFIFSYLTDDNSKLTYQMSTSAQSTSDLKKIEEQISMKEQKLKDLGWNNGINKAFLLDQLASNMPGELTWKEVAVNPINVKRGRDQKALIFDDGKIRISGFSPQIIPVNEWMARIKIQKWVKSVELESYGLNPELKTGEFTLVIHY